VLRDPVNANAGIGKLARDCNPYIKRAACDYTYFAWPHCSKCIFVMYLVESSRVVMKQTAAPQNNGGVYTNRHDHRAVQRLC